MQEELNLGTVQNVECHLLPWYDEVKESLRLVYSNFAGLGDCWRTLQKDAGEVSSPVKIFFGEKENLETV